MGADSLAAPPAGGGSREASGRVRPRHRFPQVGPPRARGQDPKAVWPRGREVVRAPQPFAMIALAHRHLAATVAEYVAANSAVRAAEPALCAGRTDHKI